MILLIGASSYVGQAFVRALRRRRSTFIPLSRKAFDYTQFEFLFDYVRKIRPEFVINAEEMSELPGAGQRLDEALVDRVRMEMFQVNTVLPQTIARVCSMTHTAWGHVSSGSIYTGTKGAGNGNGGLEGPLGYSEVDEPNFSFKRPPCTFYSGTKALAEESLRESPRCFIWRLRLAFNERDEAENYLSQVQDQAGCKAEGAHNSISHLDDCVTGCLSLWDYQAEFGTYNVVNPGAVTAREIRQMVQSIRKGCNSFHPVIYEDGPAAAMDERLVSSDCVLDSSKLRRAGVKLRGVREALETALERWESNRTQSERTLG